MAAGGLRPSDVDFMPPLLRSLSSLCRLRGKALSPQFLLAGLSGSTVSAQACLRVARKAGLTGSVLYRPRLADLSNLTLPCILLLSGNRSCVLTRLLPGAPAGKEEDEAGAASGQARAEVIFPETESTSQLVPLEALQEEYTGYALYVAVPGRPQEHVEKRAWPGESAGSGMSCAITRPSTGMWRWPASSSTSSPWPAPCSP